MIHRLHRRKTFLGLILGLWPFTVVAADIPLANPEALQEALERVEGGDRLLLAPGSYGTLVIGKASTFERRFPGEVTIASADASNPAVFDGFNLTGVSNLTMDGLVFDYTFFPKHEKRHRPFEVSYAENISIENSIFEGDDAAGKNELSDGFGYGYGLSVQKSSDVTIRNNIFRGFQRGIVFRIVETLNVLDNEITDMSGDGMNYAQVQNVRIEGNYVHDFRRGKTAPVHPDMIQFWTNKTKKPSENILIRRNVLSAGDGPYTQTIFIRNEEVDQGRAGSEMYYRNIVIAENVIINAHLHGITVGETNGLTVRNNTVVRNPNAEGDRKNKNLYTPIIRIKPKSRDVMVWGNVTFGIEGFDGQSDWIVDNNVIAQDRTRLKAGFYETLFVGGDARRRDAFRPKKGGPLDGTGIGAPEINLNCCK